MNAELKKKWIVALRSGEFKQTTSVFKRRDGHCCLGVLCEVAGQLPLGPYGFGNWDFVEAAVGSRTADHLANLNDSGKTFPEIADYIERYIPPKRGATIMPPDREQGEGK